MARSALCSIRNFLGWLYHQRIETRFWSGKWVCLAVFAVLCLHVNACRTQTEPLVEITRVPPAAQGGPDRLDIIEGRVSGSRVGQQIVLYARWGPWWVQPLTDQPFTAIRSDLTWKNSTHLGSDYAALLVDPGYHANAIVSSLPQKGSGVVAVTIRAGRPHFWQTGWFLSLSTAVIALVVLACIRLWALGVEKQMRAGFDARLGERARIARELHDCLLQGVQGLVLRLQAVRNLLPAQPEEAMQALDVALDRGDQVILEGRSTVEDLRHSSLENEDIVQDLTAIGEELAKDNGDHAPVLRVLVEGKQRELEPIVRDEIYRIAREALRNAFRHARAHKIEAEVSYGDSQFLLRVRDDGNGINPKVFQQGSRPGHWGLPGMRERAEGFGGRLEVWSESGAGTEIQLTIPSSIAYGVFSTRRKLSFLGKTVRGTNGQ